jgi:cobalt-precorrin-5B (C1)-methyltransferase
MLTGLEDKFIYKNNKKLAFGYTTGSCSAAAAKAGAQMLLTQSFIPHITIKTPQGIQLQLPIKEAQITAEYGSCAIKKDAGDDPDVTNGILIFAKVTKKSPDEMTGEKVSIIGGAGIGTVTKPGLDQPVGNKAINKVPRAMITTEVLQVCQQYGYEGELLVEIIVPNGAAVAAKTFNQTLGIVGGISILGTTGIVEPMSEKALLTSIQIELNMLKKANANIIVVVPGNYGDQFLKGMNLSGDLALTLEHTIKCSNFVGEVVDMAVELELTGLLFVSHIGKFIKVAGGIMNTHSRNSDSRMELLAAAAIHTGADIEIVKQILTAVTTEAGIQILSKTKWFVPTITHINERIVSYLSKRAYQKLEIGVILFSNQLGELGRSQNATALLHNSMKQTKENNCT